MRLKLSSKLDVVSKLILDDDLSGIPQNYTGPIALVGTWLQLKFAAVDAYMTAKHWLSSAKRISTWLEATLFFNSFLLIL